MAGIQTLKRYAFNNGFVMDFISFGKMKFNKVSLKNNNNNKEIIVPNLIQASKTKDF